MEHMLTWLKNIPVSDYTPKSLICLREGYSLKLFFHDVFAGVSVSIIALPLALAFAIGSGVDPERGVYTAIVAGFLISLLGGSRVQIAGPTGTSIVLVFATVQKHGYEGLALATFMAGIMLILMGIARLGVLLKFIPYSVTTGFTAGMALIIFTSQIKDFFGLDLDHVPPEFLLKCKYYCLNAHTFTPWAAGISLVTLGIIFLLKRFAPKFPGAIFAIFIATLLTGLFNIPLETIQSKFGNIPSSLPLPTFPSISLDFVREVFPDAIGIALLGAIESLLSAVIADGMTGHRHRSNCELVAQGIGNVGSIIFGGIPATGAVARTSANIRLGAKTPFAGMIHALTLLLLIMIFAPWASQIPLAALSAVLVYVAWTISDIPQFMHIVKGPRGDAVVLIITFALTVLVDIIVAVEVGVLLSAFLFLKKMTDKTTVEASTVVIQESHNEKPELSHNTILFRNDIPNDTVVFEIKGPFFYSVSEMLMDTLTNLDEVPRVFVLRLRDVPLVDMTGIHALKQFADKCKKEEIIFLVTEVRKDVKDLFSITKLDKAIEPQHFFSTLEGALNHAKKTEAAVDLPQRPKRERIKDKGSSHA